MCTSCLGVSRRLLDHRIEFVAAKRARRERLIELLNRSRCRLRRSALKSESLVDRLGNAGNVSLRSPQRLAVARERRVQLICSAKIGVRAPGDIGDIFLRLCDLALLDPNRLELIGVGRPSISLRDDALDRTGRDQASECAAYGLNGLVSLCQAVCDGLRGAVLFFQRARNLLSRANKLVVFNDQLANSAGLFVSSFNGFLDLA